MLKEAF